jgi:hypothetical protein
MNQDNETVVVDAPVATSPFTSAVAELKHSVRVHMTVTHGPSPQLAAYLTKTIDFLEEEDQTLRLHEIELLACSIIEGAAFYVQQAIDGTIRKAHEKGTKAPKLKDLSDRLLVAIASARRTRDMAAKNVLLTVLAEVMKELTLRTNSAYPVIVDKNGAEL